MFMQFGSESVSSVAEPVTEPSLVLQLLLLAKMLVLASLDSVASLEAILLKCL